MYNERYVGGAGGGWAGNMLGARWRGYDCIFTAYTGFMVSRQFSFIPLYIHTYIHTYPHPHGREVVLVGKARPGGKGEGRRVSEITPTEL